MLTYQEENIEEITEPSAVAISNFGGGGGRGSDACVIFGSEIRPYVIFWGCWKSELFAWVCENQCHFFEVIENLRYFFGLSK